MRVTDLKRRDRRDYDRLPLRLMCSLAGSRDNAEPVMIGVTENISRREVLICWTAEANTIPRPNYGDLIAVVIKLPLGSRYLRCSGRVVSVSTRRDGCILVAVEVHRMSFSSETMAKCAAN
jgi:hypothetical protein